MVKEMTPAGRARRLSLKACAGIAALMAFGAAGGAWAAAAAQPGLDGLQGVWVVTEAERQQAPLPSLKNGVLTITGDKFRLERGILDTWMGDLRIDPAKGAIDFVHQGEQMVAPVKGDLWEGTYRVNGDMLEIVTATGHEARPTQFRTGYDITLMKLRRR